MARAADVLGLGILAVAAALLALGADIYTSRVSALARRLRVSALAIGLLVAGAEPEELVTTVIASSRHQPGIAAGDAIGANVTMLTVVLGTFAVLQPLPVTHRIRSYTGAACAASILVALLMTGGSVSRAEGALLVAMYLVFFAWVVVREHAQPTNVGGVSTAGRNPTDPRPGGAHALLALGGLGMVTLGGWLAVVGADRVISGLGLAESGVGLTLVAFATSAELLALIWAARRHGVTELAFVAVIGSVVGNATATVGAGALVRPLSTNGVVAAAWFSAGLVSLLLLPWLWEQGRSRVVGTLLVITYVVYVAIALI